MTNNVFNILKDTGIEECSFDLLWPRAWLELLLQDAGQDFFQAHDLAKPEPPVNAIRVSPGVGKTRTVVEIFAKFGGPLVYVLPTHRLGDEVVEAFGSYGLSARLFRGRLASDPMDSGTKMCRDPGSVQLAVDHGIPVSESCCKGKTPKGDIVQCPFFDTCSYQSQLKGEPEVWVIPNQLLFQAQKALGTPRCVVIDESFWQSGLHLFDKVLELDEMYLPVDPPAGGSTFAAEELGDLRRKLAQALRSQHDAGGVRRATLEDGNLTQQECTRAIALEWQMKDKLEMWPGMPAEVRQKVAKKSRNVKQVQAFVRIWQAARAILGAHRQTSASGHLYLEEADNGGRVTRCLGIRRIKPIAKQWHVPTLIMDATLPPQSILRSFYPDAQVIKEVEAEMQHVSVRQVLGAPVTTTKLSPKSESSSNRNLEAVRRAIIGRFLELDRQPTLVIAQKEPADWLRGSGMPDGITIEHFNNVAGLDQHKNVRLLISVGRPAPIPAAVEALAAAITGLEPRKLTNLDRTFRWYDRVAKGIRLPDGSGVLVHCDIHPDPVAEACRWQICEGELIQAIGRARGVNRTEASPLMIEIWSNIVLPITVNEVLHWSDIPCGFEIDLIAGGILLESPTDSAKCWPSMWPTAGAARQWRRRAGEHKCTKCYIDTYIASRTLVARYQHKGERQKWRHAWYDPTIISDLRDWLEERLGQLARVEVKSKEPPEAVALNAGA